ncbi:MAG: permease [Myxococcota bacterium]
MALWHAIWATLLELSPWLLLGAVVAGVLHRVLPPGFIGRHLGGRGGVLKAVALGVPLPLCSCGVIPAGLGLRRDGASPGASVGFLISTPQTGVDSILVSASMLGWPFALLKLAVAGVTGLVGGWLTDATGAGDDDARPSGSGSEAATEGPRSVRAAVNHGVDVLRTIWRWLVFGVVVSALITTFVPPSVFASFTGSGELVSLVAVLLLALPLYVCATASVPIAAALVAGGFPPGAALVFLMAGPATNLATLGAVHRGLGRRALVIYVATIVAGSISAAVLFDFVLTGTAAVAHVHAEHASPVAIASSVLLLGLLAWFAFEDLRAWWPRGASPTVEAAVVELPVQGMTCGGCANRLQRALLADPGVVEATVDLEGKRATVRTTTSGSRIRDIVEEAGFQPGEASLVSS